MASSHTKKSDLINLTGNNVVVIGTNQPETGQVDANNDQAAKQVPPLTAQILQQKARFFLGKSPVHKFWKKSSKSESGSDNGAFQSNEAANEIENAQEKQLDQENSSAMVSIETSRPQLEREARIATFRQSSSGWLQISQYAAVFITVAWITYVTIYLLSLPGTSYALIKSPLTFGGVVASVLAPIAMVWLCLSAWQRRSDASMYARAFRAEIQSFLFPGETQSKALGEDLQLLIKQALEISAASRASVKAVQRARMGLHEEIRNLNEVSQNAENRIDHLTGSLASQAEEILSLSEIIENQSNLLGQKSAQGIKNWENIASEIDEIAEEVGELFDQGAAKINMASECAKERVLSLDSSLSALCEKFTNNINQSIATADQSAIETLHKTTGLFDLHTNKINDSAARLYVDLESLLQRVQVVVTELKINGENFVSQATVPLDMLSESIRKFEDQTSHWDSRVSDGIKDMDYHHNQMSQAFELLTAKFQEGFSNAGKIGGELKLQAEAIEQRVSLSTQKLAQSIDEMDVQSVAITNRLETQSIHISTIIKASQTQILQMGDSLGQKSENILSEAARLNGELKKLEADIVDRFSQIEKTGQNVVDSLVTNLERTNDSHQKILPTYNQITQSAQALLLEFLQLNAETENKTNKMILAMKQLRGEILSDMHGLEAAANHGTMTLSRYTDQLSDSHKTLKQDAQDAAESLALIQSGVSGKIDDLHLVTDQVRAKVESLQRDLGGYLGDVSAMVSEATSDLDIATKAFVNHSDMLDAKIDSTSRKLIAANQTYLDEGQRINLLAEQAALRASHLVKNIHDENAKLINSSAVSLATIQDATEVLGAKANEMDSYLQSSLHNAQHYSEQLKSEINDISEVSVSAVERMMIVINQLTDQVRDILAVSNIADQNITLVSEKLVGETNRMLVVTEKAVTAADEAGNMFSKNTASLCRAVQDILDQARKLKETQLRQGRDAFLSSSKFVIESLYSLAVDVSRHLEGTVDHRTLRAYQKGDVAAFTRHLIEIAHKIPLDKCQQKFIDDVDFRTYVLRFIRQYEEILEQSISNDYGELLSALFRTSDVGKLYQILCVIAEHDAK